MQNNSQTCHSCEQGDVPIKIDSDGVFCSVSGKKGVLCHSIEEYTWRCKKDRYKRAY